MSCPLFSLHPHYNLWIYIFKVETADNLSTYAIKPSHSQKIYIEFSNLGSTLSKVTYPYFNESISITQILNVKFIT